MVLKCNVDNKSGIHLSSKAKPISVTVKPDRTVQINENESPGLYDDWGYWDIWSRSDKYDLLMDRPDYDASEEDEYLTMSWSQLPDYMKKELNMAMFLRGEE